MKDYRALIVSQQSWYIRVRHDYRTIILPCAVFFSVLFILAHYLFKCMLPEEGVLRTAGSYINYFAVFCQLLILLGVLFQKKNTELWLLLLNIGWMALSRFLLGSYSFPRISSVTRWSIMCCCFYVSGVCLSKKQHAFLLDLVALGLTAVLTLWATVGIPTAILGKSLPGFSGISMAVEYVEPPLKFLSFFGVHRNVSATYFICAAGLLLYQCCRERNKLWRIIASIFVPLSGVSIYLQKSRSNILAFFVILSLTFILILGDRLKTVWRNIAKLTCFLTFVFCIILIYMPVGSCGDVEEKTAVRSEQASIEMMSDDLGLPATTEPIQIPNSRTTLQAIFTLTGRVTIWAQWLPAVQEKPEIALFGQPEQTAMDIINKRLVPPMAHMHNALFQQLLVAGIPGFLLYLLFFLSIIRKIAISFFQKNTTKTIGLKVMASVVLGLIIYGVFEPLLSPEIPVASMLFCLMAGSFVRDYETL